MMVFLLRLGITWTLQMKTLHGVKKRQAVNTSMRRRASMIVTDNFGNKIEVGYKSEIIGVSLKDNPDAVRGKAGMLILWEEAGTFPELKSSMGKLLDHLQNKMALLLVS